MKSKASWFIVAALGAAAVSAVLMGRGKAEPVLPPGEGRYLTGCTAVDAGTVEGFVMNTGPGLIQINGLVSFGFTVAGVMSHPTIQVQGAASIPPGRTVSVAKTRLVWNLLPNEVCQLDVSGAVR